MLFFLFCQNKNKNGGRRTWARSPEAPGLGTTFPPEPSRLQRDSSIRVLNLHRQKVLLAWQWRKIRRRIVRLLFLTKLWCCLWDISTSFRSFRYREYGPRQYATREWYIGEAMMFFVYWWFFHNFFYDPGHLFVSDDFIHEKLHIFTCSNIYIY